MGRLHLVLSVAAITAGTIFHGEPAAAQLPDGQPPLLANVQSLGLDTARNEITVYFAPQYRTRALAARSLIEEGIRFYRDSLGVAPDLSLAVLAPGEWQKVVTWQPYGMPGVAGRPAVAFLPATDDNLAASDALDLKPGVSTETKAKLARAGLSWEDGSRRYVELVGLHELGHTYARAAGIRSPNRWVGELLATYFAWTFLRAHHPARATLWDGILDGYVDVVQPQHTTLDDFERLYFGVGARNYVWYQARLQEMVERAHDELGMDFIRRMQHEFPDDGSPAPSHAETIRRLEAVVPGFAEWAERMQAARTSETP